MPRSHGDNGVAGGRRLASDGGEPAEAWGARLPSSAVADLLESRRRRRAIACLAESQGPIPVSDLARFVVADEQGTSPRDVPFDAVEDAREDLFQHHLPKLVATGVVSYNSLVGTVELASEDPRLLGDEEGPVDDPAAPE